MTTELHELLRRWARVPSSSGPSNATEAVPTDACSAVVAPLTPHPDGRVPPVVEVDDVRGGSEIEARAARLERKHEEGRLAGLEALDQRRPIADSGFAVQDEA